MAEALGFVLSVVPLLISAAEHYGEAHDMVSTYRHYTDETKELCDRLKVQRTIFRSHTRRLLASCVGQDEAVQMLEDVDHARWADPALHSALETTLGDTENAVNGLLSLLDSKLQGISRECAQFEEILGQDSKDVAFGSKAWRHATRQKFRLAFKKLDLLKSIKNVRSLTQDYGALVLQTAACPLDSTAIPRATLDTKAISDFTIVRTAAKSLYEALGSACTKHTEHGAQFSLQPIVDEEHPHVRFTLALRRRAKECTVNELDRLTWLTLETVFTGSFVKATSPLDPSPLSRLNKALKRTERAPSRSPSPSPVNRKKGKKSVQFHLPHPPAPLLPSSQSTDVSSSTLDQTLQNLCTNNNFCTLLKRLLNDGQLSQKGSCIGYLENSRSTKYLVYLDTQSQSIAPTSVSKPVSLASLISESGYHDTDGTKSTMPQLERLSLARQLAIAVLRFHETPWLASSWSSSDVYFVTSTKTLSTPLQRLGDPYVNFAPNAFLFGLGVVLLELAFGQPLRNMQKPGDVTNSSDGRHTDFFTARRVSRNSSSALGWRYSRIAQKCIQCDFGCGDDLEDANLQLGVYRDVVCELENLEQGLRKLGIV